MRISIYKDNRKETGAQVYGLDGSYVKNVTTHMFDWLLYDWI